MANQNPSKLDSHHTTISPDHTQQYQADKSAAVIKINGLELKILQLSREFKGLASSEGKRIDFVVASLSRCTDDRTNKVEALVISYVDYRTSELNIHLVGQINQVDRRVSVVKKGLDAYVAQSETNLVKHIDDTKEELKADIKKVDDRLDEVKEELKGDIRETKEELKTDIGKVETDLGKRIDDTKAELKTDIKKVETDLGKRIDDTKAELKADIKKVDERLDEVKGELKTDIKKVDERLDEVKEELKTDIKKVDERLDEVKGKLKTDIKKVNKRVNKRMDRLEKRFLWPIWVTLFAGFISNIFGKQIAHSLVNTAVNIFETVASFIS
ncbi:MAG: hypothetical protein ISN29_11375 [Gammaproteobacteria bacterium AqS3]|nr:hypothetical protein [Gammaproteobacteria bacterium AqS3]